MFEFAGLAYRNPSYVTKNARASWEVSKTMKQFKKDWPYCAWCGREKKLEVHHKQPVSVAPSLAADALNMITLCHGCHLYVGHAGSYRYMYVADISDICDKYSPTWIENKPNEPFT